MEDEGEGLQEGCSSPDADNGPTTADNSTVVDPQPNEQGEGGGPQPMDPFAEMRNGPIIMLISDLIESRSGAKAKPEPKPAPKLQDADD